MNDMVMKFDTLEIAERLERGGFTRAQAKTQAGALAGVANIERLDVATRAELIATERTLREEIIALRNELKAEIADIRHELRGFKRVCVDQFNLLRWMMGFLLAGAASLMAKLFFGLSVV